MTRLLPPFVALAAAALVSCTGGDGLSPTAVPDAETATASAEPRDCPAGEPGSSGDIDWVEPPVRQADRRGELSTVRERRAPLQSKDGDAAFLDPGTPIYSLQDYAPSFRVTAESPTGDGFTVYEASTNPNAETGADILDIRGKVTLFRVRSTSGGSRSTDVRDADEITSIVGMVLDSAADHADRGVRPPDSGRPRVVARLVGVTVCAYPQHARNEY